ncbi:unnamed protein product [Paramecium primaurelia]|uniref:Transmembrane protein n=1 Tax=Paramecium primaurelia TaxID=5886 RepID=A0A8S1QQU6_PARPR|nr:unnamed protein product [Paramecium primaurelia]
MIQIRYAPFDSNKEISCSNSKNKRNQFNITFWRQFFFKYQIQKYSQMMGFLIFRPNKILILISLIVFKIKQKLKFNSSVCVKNQQYQMIFKLIIILIYIRNFNGDSLSLIGWI